MLGRYIILSVTIENYIVLRLKQPQKLWMLKLKVLMKISVRSGPPSLPSSGHLTPANNSVKISLITRSQNSSALSNEVSLSHLPPLPSNCVFEVLSK